MTSSLTIPKGSVPIGRVSIGGVDYDVSQHPEFVRFFFDIARRGGGISAQTNTELSVELAAIDADARSLRSDPVSQEAMRGVEELRNEVASVRSDADAMRRRIEQLEDRLV